MPLVPEWTASAGAQYTFAMPNGREGYLYADAAYRDKSLDGLFHVVGEEALGYGAPYEWAHYAEVPFHRLARPLTQASVAIVTTAAPYQPDRGDQGPGAPYNAAAKFFTVYSGDTGRDHESLVTRPRDFFDNATPSGTSVAIDVLLRLALLTDNADYERRAAGCLRTLVPFIEQAPTAFLIGGADGLDARTKAQAALLLRLSSLTLPHALAQVLLAEQLYRAATRLTGHPYHRE